MSMSMSYTLLNKNFSEEGVGLCEEMGLQPISELFTTDGGWSISVRVTIYCDKVAFDRRFGQYKSFKVAPTCMILW